MSGLTRTITRRARLGFTLIELLVVIGIILLLVALTITVGSGVLRQSEVRETQNTLRLLEVAVQEWETAVDRQVLYGINGEPCVANPNAPGHERYELQQVRKDGSNLGATPTNPWGTGPLAQDEAYEDAEWTTDRLWAILSRTTTVRDIIARVNPDFVEEFVTPGVLMNPEDALYSLTDPTKPTFHFTDSWGREIIAVLPGRAYNPLCNGGAPYTRDVDGTIRTPFENRFGVAADRRIFFVSAGPSGVFGGLHLDTATGNLSPEQQEDIKDASDNIYSYPVHIDSARPTP